MKGNNDIKTLVHSTYRCQYHIVFAPKYRRQIIYGKIKKDVSIWNINSFAEFYMQIQEKYKKDYALAIERFKAERRRFLSALSEIEFIEVIPTQANYFMIKIKDKYNAEEITNILMDQYGILIKDLSSKVGDKYIRVAIRNEEDNNKFVAAIKKL